MVVRGLGPMCIYDKGVRSCRGRDRSTGRTCVVLPLDSEGNFQHLDKLRHGTCPGHDAMMGADNG